MYKVVNKEILKKETEIVLKLYINLFLYKSKRIIEYKKVEGRVIARQKYTNSNFVILIKIIRIKF